MNNSKLLLGAIARTNLQAAAEKVGVVIEKTGHRRSTLWN